MDRCRRRRSPSLAAMNGVDSSISVGGVDCGAEEKAKVGGGDCMFAMVYS